MDNNLTPSSNLNNTILCIEYKKNNVDQKAMRKMDEQCNYIVLINS